MNQLDFSDKLALVTGASRGIGRAVALELGKAGAHVIIAARRTGALEYLDDEIRNAGGTATLVHLDLMAGDKIDLLGPTIYERWGKLDLVAACASILGPISPLPHITQDTWEAVLNTNLYANWRLIRSIDPVIRKAEAARVVFATCAEAAGSLGYWGPYAVSKAGLEALVKTYAVEMMNTPVRVNLVDPGAVRTELRAKAFPGEDPKTLPPPGDVVPLFLSALAPECEVSGETFRGKAA